MTAPEPRPFHVETGASAETWTVSPEEGVKVEIRKFSVGPMDNNVYLVTCEGEMLVIDAANDIERILSEISQADSSADGGIDVTKIITTHGHPDHWQALADLCEATGATAMAHPDDAPMIPVPTERPLEHDAKVSLGSVELGVIAVPGHTPGSICLLLGERDLFSGDTLFPGGFGKTEDEETFDALFKAGKRRLFDRLDDDCRVHPGHGDSTTIGAERPDLKAWKKRRW